MGSKFHFVPLEFQISYFKPLSRKFCNKIFAIIVKFIFHDGYLELHIFINRNDAATILTLAHSSS